MKKLPKGHKHVFILSLSLIGLFIFVFAVLLVPQETLSGYGFFNSLDKDITEKKVDIENLDSASKESLFPSKIKRKIMMAADLSKPLLLREPGLAPSLAEVFDGIILEHVSGARQTDSDEDISLSEIAPTIFSRECPLNTGCSVSWFLEDVGVSVIPGITFFTNANEINLPSYDCSACDGRCTNACVRRNEEGFDWWDDEYWLGIEKTFQAAANFVCSTSGQIKAIYTDQEVYWGYYLSEDGVKSSWNEIPEGRSQEEYVAKVFDRAR